MAVTRQPIPTPEERANSLFESEARARREAFRDQLRTSVECIAWSAVGIVGLGWSFHVTDAKLGWVLFWGGLAVGNAGILFALVRFYWRAEERGDA